MLLRLKVTEGSLAGQTTELSAGQVAIIGRADRSDFRIVGDRHLSGRHLLVECCEDGCRLLDLNSTNGSWLNGAKVEDAELHDGDMIVAGRTIIQVSIDPDDGSGLERPPLESLRTVHTGSSPESPSQADPPPSSIHDRVCRENLDEVPLDESTDQMRYPLDFPLDSVNAAIPKPASDSCQLS